MFRTAPGEARALIEDWINRPTLRELVEAFGGTWPTGTLEEQVAELAEFSKIWDYRSGASRLIFHDAPEAEDPHAELTYRAAKELGMMDPPPPSENEYDYMLILGGLATGVEPRVKYAAKLIEDGLKIRKQIAGLGSYRELHEKELPVSRKYAPEGRYEIDHLAAMMAAFFAQQWEPPDLQIKDRDTTATTWEMHSPGSDAGVAAYAAASSQPGKRPANTADTYTLFRNSVRVSSTATILLITSTVYVPYQHFDGVRILHQTGATIETIGARPVEVNSTKPHHSSAYRQEVRSVLMSALKTIYSEAQK